MKRFFLLLVLGILSNYTSGQVNGPGSGHSLSFDGVDDYGEASIPAVVNIPYSVEYWIKQDGITTFPNCVISYEDDTADFTHPYYGFWTGVNTQGAPFMHYGDGTGAGPGSRRSAVSQNNIIMKAWTHICWVINGPNNFDLYVNGEPQNVNYSGSGNAVMAHNPNSEPTAFGKQERWGPYWVNNWYFSEIQFDEVRLWNGVRSQPQIRKNMCKKLTGNEPGLVGYWRFDEGTGTTALDSSPNNYNSTLY